MKTYYIIKLLEIMAVEGKRNFSPLYICEQLNIKDEKEVAILLFSLTDIVKPNYEVECPEGDTDFAVDNLDSITSEPRICHLCGAEYVPDPKRIWVSFNFVDSFKDEVKKKKHFLQINPHQRAKRKMFAMD